MNRTIALLLATGLGCAAAGVSAQAHRRVFISPMGEPFRGTDAAPDPERAWFAQADANGDGAVTAAEFRADAARFFAILDRKHDGEIDPDDIDYYENTLAPEVRSSEGPGMMTGGSGSEGESKPPAYDSSRLGAARFSYFDLPEPVTSADRNLNRGIDAREFADAADKRFASLDKKNDGKLVWDELPHVSARMEGQRRGKGGPGGGRGGHRGGGHGMRGGGGGFGGSSGGFGGD
ncbi:MAG: EF-hand domain-containing protein [Sphingomonas sp.]